MKSLGVVRTAAAAAMMMVAAPALAQNVSTLECKGTVDGGSYADVIVSGQDCTLKNATVNGSVKVGNGASFVGEAITVLGGVELFSAGNLDLLSGYVTGRVSVKDSGYVMIEKYAKTGELKVESSGEVTVYGEVASIMSVGSGSTTLKPGARTFPGGVTTVFGGDLTVCGAYIGISPQGFDGSGGIVALQSKRVSVGDGCMSSQVEGSIIVEKGEGAVSFVDINDATAAGIDLSVIEQTGDVTISGANLSDIKLVKNTGTITIYEVMTDSDTTIAENGGDGTVSIMMSTFGSDAEIKNNGYVGISNSWFSGEDVIVSGNGNVDLSANADLNIAVTENNDVNVAGNQFTDASITKNGIVNVTGNTGEVLVCFDNAVVIDGGGNTIVELTDGQCAGF